MIDQDGQAKSVPRKVDRRRLWLVLAAVTVLITIGVAAWLLTRSPGVYTGGRAKTSGPPVPWPTILAVAEQEAHKIDKDSLVSGFPAATTLGFTTWGITNSVLIHFTYARANGRMIDISFEDASPVTTLEVQDRENAAGLGFEMYRLAQEQLQERYRRLTELKLGPREAVQRTWDQVRQTARENGIADPQPKPISIILSEEQLAWSIIYIVDDAAVPTPDWDEKPVKVEGSFSGRFIVDDRTGEILSSEYTDKRGTIIYEGP
ncbi:MAG: hypothetical protein M3441_12615 [Chloroflexota bacterium]|nr:hypothetical protein [Chloroflexota bacterium]